MIDGRYRAGARYLAGLFAALLFVGNTAAFELQELATPPETTLSWVGKDIVQNGMPMQIIELRSTLSVEEIKAFYRQDWLSYHRVGERSSVQRRVGQWDILSTLIDNHNVVVQLKQDGGLTTGFLSTHPLDLEPEPSQVSEKFPRKWGTELISSTESNDAGVVATTLVLQNQYTVRENKLFYEAELVRNGWSMARSTINTGTVVMLFNRSSGALELAMRREDNNTLIFANVRDKDV